MHGLPCVSTIEPEKFVDDAKLMVEEKTITIKNSIKTASCNSSSTSSIGKNSDNSGISLNNNNVSEDTDEEAQSSYKNPLDSMQTLEDVLPIRRGISKFYNGKSKSFASLADAASSKELTKAEDGYSKRRRNLVAYSVAIDKSRSRSLLRSSRGAIGKRVPKSSRKSLALAVAMNSSSEHGMVARSPPLLSCPSTPGNLRQILQPAHK